MTALVALFSTAGCGLVAILLAAYGRTRRDTGGRWYLAGACCCVAAAVIGGLGSRPTGLGIVNVSLAAAALFATPILAAAAIARGARDCGEWDTDIQFAEGASWELPVPGAKPKRRDRISRQDFPLGVAARPARTLAAMLVELDRDITTTRAAQEGWLVHDPPQEMHQRVHALVARLRDTADTRGHVAEAADHRDPDLARVAADRHREIQSLDWEARRCIAELRGRLATAGGLDEALNADKRQARLEELRARLTDVTAPHTPAPE
jgi:hypothetical protein